MGSILTEQDFNARWQELRSPFYFNPSRLDEVENRMKADIEDELRVKSETEKSGRNYSFDETMIVSCIRTRALEYAGEIVKSLNNQDTFPLRHVENIPAVMASNHPAWRLNLDGIISRLGQGYIFILLGPRGTGKTQLSVTVARYLVETKRGSSRYAVLGDLFTQIKGTFKPDSRDSEEKILDALSNCGLLVLDEVHEIGGSDWQNRIFTLLIDSRYRAKRSTILITNDTEDDFLHAVGASVADRIAEVGFFVNCDWQSFRRART